MTILGIDSDGCDTPAHVQGMRLGTRSWCAFNTLRDLDFQLLPWNLLRPQDSLRRKDFFLYLKIFHPAKENNQLTEMEKYVLDLSLPLSWAVVDVSVHI